MITIKVLLRIIPLGTCSLTPCEYQYIPFGCLCYYKITPSHAYYICHPVVTNFNQIFTSSFFLPFFCYLFLTKSYVFAKLTLDIMAAEWSLK